MSEKSLSALIEEVKSIGKRVKQLEAKNAKILADYKEIKDYIETHIKQTYQRVKR